MATLYQAMLIGNYCEKITLSLSLSSLTVSLIPTLIGVPIAGFVFDYCGAKTTIVAAVTLNLVGYGTLWAVATGTLPQSTGLLLVACVLAGHGSGYFDASAIVAMTLNFPKSRGASSRAGTNPMSKSYKKIVAFSKPEGRRLASVFGAEAAVLGLDDVLSEATLVARRCNRSNGQS